VSILSSRLSRERVKIQVAPGNLHWCSDTALEMLADFSARYKAPTYMHLVETAYQKEYARRRGGGTALDYIDRFGFLGPLLTLDHGVRLNEADLRPHRGDRDQYLPQLQLEFPAAQRW
jgi:5-methylthioadenosine/S-adenosylhomocysteine deaminase